MDIMHSLKYVLHVRTLFKVNFNEVVETFTQMFYSPRLSDLTRTTQQQWFQTSAVFPFKQKGIY